MAKIGIASCLLFIYNAEFYIYQVIWNSVMSWEMFCLALLNQPTSGSKHLCRSVCLDELYSLLKIDVTWFDRAPALSLIAFIPSSFVDWKGNHGIKHVFVSSSSWHMNPSFPTSFSLSSPFGLHTVFEDCLCLIPSYIQAFSTSCLGIVAMNIPRVSVSPSL
jgi:hypothetical protein